MATKESRELLNDINEAVRHIPPGSTWKHYKGGIYRINDFVVDTDDGSIRVLYNRLAGPNFDIAIDPAITYARPFKEWFEDVESEPKTFIPRFERVQRVERWHTDEELAQLKKESEERA